MVIHELEEVKVEEEEDKKQKVCRTQRRFYGLQNQGSTCYLNSVLQVLFMTPELHDKFETSETITKQQRLDPQLQTIDEELWNLFKLLEKTICNTESLTKILHITNVHEQCDAAECLEKILNQISSRASEIFQGVLRNTTKCFEDHSIIEDSDPFWTLPVSLKDSSDSVVSVKGAFEMIFQPTAFSEDNMVHCSECRTKTEAMSVSEMEKSPQILILLLKRFDFDYYLMSYVKSDCQVDVPRTLQMKEKEYELYGIVHHMGSLRFGHYTATILSSEDNTWYKFNDSYVNKAEEQLFKQTDNYTSRTAYLLIYRASGCPGDKVRDDQELESEKEVDVGHEKEEPINNEMDDSAPDPQQNLSDLPEMNPGDESGLEDGEITNYDSAPAEIPPHQMKTDRCLDNKPTSDHVEASGCPGVEVRDDHRVEQELESEKDVDVGHEKEEPIIQEMEDSAPDPQQNPSDLPEMNPGDECGVKEEGLQDGDISSNYDSAPAEIPPHQMNTDRCLDNKPTSDHVEASGCPGVEMRDDHQVEQELEAEKEVDAELKKDEPTNNEMEDSARDPQQNPGVLSEMKPCGVKDEGLEDGEITNYDSAPAEIPPHQINTDRCLDNKPTSDHVEASGCPGVEVRDDHQVEQELESEKEVDVGHEKEEPINNEMEDSAPDPQQNPSDLPEMNPGDECGIKEEGPKDEEISNIDSAPAEIPLHQITLESEKKADAEHGKEECSVIIAMMENSPLNLQQNPSEPCVGVKDEGLQDQEISSNYDSAPAEIPLHEMNTDRCEPTSVHVEASGCPGVEVRDDHQDEEEFEAEKDVDVEHEKEEPINAEMEDSAPDPQQNPGVLSEMKPCVIKEEGLEDGEITNYDSAPAEIPPHQMNTDRCLDNKPTSDHVEASGCPGVEVRDDHQVEQELESEKDVDAEHEKEEPIIQEMEDSARNPQQRPSDLPEMNPGGESGIKEEGPKDEEISNIDSAPAEIPLHQIKLKSEKKADAEHGKEECSVIIDMMEYSPLNLQQNPSEPCVVLEMKPWGVKEEGFDSAPCQEDEVRHDPGNEEELESEKNVDAEHGMEECSITIDEDSPLNPLQNLQERKPWGKKEEDEDFPKSSRSPLRRRLSIPRIPLWVLFVFLLFLLILLLLFLSFLLL